MTDSAPAGAQAETLLECRREDRVGYVGLNCYAGEHDPDCPARYRPAVTAALQAKDDRIAALEAENTALRAAMAALLAEERDHAMVRLLATGKTSP